MMMFPWSEEDEAIREVRVIFFKNLKSNVKIEECLVSVQINES